MRFWFTKRAAKPARWATAKTHPFICVYHYPVRITYHLDVIPAEVQKITGCGRSVIEQQRHLVWHSEVFTRDDIMEEQVQRGSPRIHVGTPVRSYFPTAECRLESLDGRLLVMCPGPGSNAFFAGFATGLAPAMAYVATGDTAGLVRPC